MVHIYEMAMTPEVLSAIQQIDDQYYTETITDKKWYTDRYKPHHKAFMLLDESECRVVGYAAAVPVKKELFNALVSGVLVGDIQINPEMFAKESEYMYIPSVLLLEEYRGNGYGSKLLETLLNYYPDKKLCCITVSENGRKLAKKFLSHHRCLPGCVDVFVSENYQEK